MMTILTRASNNQPVSLGKQIASSGEGVVWETNLSGYLAKIYHAPTPERIKKLEVMVVNPPADPMLSQNHISIAWPDDLLKDGSGAAVGFLMPVVRQSRELPSIYNPRLRKRNAPGFNWYYLHATALNTAWIIQEVHAKDYVLGDIKPQNILVNDSALVAVIDTDSFQVRDLQTGQVYRCTVGSDGFTPVELLGKDFFVTDQTEIHDRFRLAVLIHYLLFGYHPFSGEWTGSGESPDQTELIRSGFWYGGQNSLIRPSQNIIPLDVVHPEIKRCFLKCFNDGHTTPHLRPTAEDWHNALQVAVDNLTVCGKVDSHHYSKHYGKCYWCERAAKLGVDIFPFVPAASSSTVKTTITPSTVIQISSSTPISQASKPTILQPLSNSPPITLPSQQSPLNTGLSDWQKAVITGGVIGAFLLIGLLLTRQQPLPTQASSEQPVQQQNISSAPDISSSVESSPESLEESTASSDSTPERISTQVPNQNSDSPQLPSISQQEAVDLLHKWQEYKRRIFAPPYERDLGDEILTSKAYHDNITRSDGQESSSEWLVNNGAYYAYGVQSVDSVENFAANGERATIDVVVTEQRTLYKSNDSIDRNASAFDTRLVRYNLQSENGQWKIADYHTIKTISKR